MSSINPRGGPEPRITETVAGPRDSTHTVVIVLPGGRARDRSPARPTRLANLRMIPIAAAAGRAVPDGRVAVWRLLYRYRGWNEPYLDPVQDVRWALNEARTRHPGARVVLVGHSMGGRAALYAAGDRSVVAVCALAPWIEPGAKDSASDPVDQVAGRHLLLAHGDRDRVTDPAGSRWFAAEARGVAASVRLVTVAGDGHAMVLRWREWHELVRDFIAGVVGAVSHDRHP